MKRFAAEGLAVAAFVLAVNLLGGCASLNDWWSQIDWPDVTPPAETNAPPMVVTNEPPVTPPPSTDGQLSDAEALALIAKMSFLDGTKKTDPNALRLVRMYGTRISHFGGGNEPGRKPDETNLWKPTSDNNGKLVVITASSTYNGGVIVNGEKVTGMSIGNGWRPHYRLSKTGSAYGTASVEVIGVGKATIKTTGTKQSFKTSGTSVAEPPAQPDPPAAVDDSETFSWTPTATGIRVRVPKSYRPWKFHVFSLRKHANLYGPVDGNASEWIIPLTGEQLRQASLAANDSGAVMPFVKTAHAILGGGNQAGWRVYDPRQAVTGSATQLKDGEDH